MRRNACPAPHPPRMNHQKQDQYSMFHESDTLGLRRASRKATSKVVVACSLFVWMRALTVTVVAVAVAALSGVTHSADGTGAYATHGLGSEKCGRLTAAIGEGAVEVQQNALSWLAGYVTAANRFKGETFDTLPFSNAEIGLNIVLEACRSNPEASFDSVAATLVDTFAPIRVQSSSPIVEAAVDGRKVPLRRSALVAVQEALIEGNHLAGKADGVFGRMTVAALRSYQKEQGLPETGLPDAGTMLRLLSGVP